MRLVVSGSIEIFIKSGLFHGIVLTVTGKTLAENVADAVDLDFDTAENYFPDRKSD